MAERRFGPGAIISGVMIALGIFVGGRLVLRSDDPLTGTLLLDIAFAFFFIARGALYFWTASRRRAAGGGDP